MFLAAAVMAGASGTATRLSKPSKVRADSKGNCARDLTPPLDHALSVALFAPGWVYENFDTRDFLSNQYK